jgi:hypothetical protein
MRLNPFLARFFPNVAVPATSLASGYHPSLNSPRLLRLMGIDGDLKSPSIFPISRSSSAF